jgi:Fe-S cluster assembly protein SufD
VSAGAAEAAFRRALAGATVRPEPVWLLDLRHEAREAFLARGLPTTRDEDWRFTPLGKLEKFDFAKRAELTRSLPKSLPAGVTVSPLSSDSARGLLGSCGDPKRRPFEALNTALFDDGRLISIAPGVRLERPLEVVFQSFTGASHARTVLHLGAGSEATVIERHWGAAEPAFVNAVTELRLERDARATYVLSQELPDESFGFFGAFSRQESGSELRMQSIASGAALARVEIEARLEGEGARLELDGLYLGRGTQHQDHHTTIDHAMPRTESRELFKGILDGRAHGVFHGRIHVRPDAQKIDASQTNRALLLADGAVIDSKPQLEIYADDVKCSHGASVGQLDPDALFYLRARGLGEAEARALLTSAFASEVLEKLPASELRAHIEKDLLGWLGGRR